MLHFFDMLHIRLHAEGVVSLAVRVSDNRVDEYQLEADTFRGMVDAYEELPEESSGPDALRVRVDPERRLVSLAIAVSPIKREVYRVGQSQFEAALASFRALDREG